MIWPVLSGLALSQGMRLSWRDLARHAAHVPDAALPEVAVLSLYAHGVAAQVQRFASWDALAQSGSGPVAALLKDGHWVFLSTRNRHEAHVQTVLAENQTLSPPQTWSAARLEAELEGTTVGLSPRKDATPLSAGPQDWFWGVFAQLRTHYGDCVVAAVLVNLLALASSMFSMNVYDRVIPNAAMHSLWTLAVGVLLAAVLELGLRMLRAQVLDDAGKRADLALSAVLLRHMLNLRAADRPASSGQWVSQLREFESVRDFVSSSTLVALTDLPFAVLFLAVVAWMGGPLVWLTLLAALLTVVVGWLTQFPIKKAVARYQYENTQKHAYLIEVLERLETIEALGAQPVVQGRWERVCAAASRSAMATRMASAFTVNASQFIQQTANVLLIIWGVHLILAGQLTVGALIGCSILAGRALSPLGQVAALMARWQHTKQAFQSVDKLMNLPLREDPSRTYVQWPQPLATLTLESLRVRYPRSEVDVLRLDHLQFQVGDVVVVSGPVGSGKSTLLRVLAGLLWPTDGRVLVNGLEARQISPADWRAHVAWAGQDTVLFRGSLRENLLMGASHVSDARLVQVLQLCGLDRLVAMHPMGLDMPLGEGGQTLSGGQRQWVSLARALLADAQVLVLDEPTSAMDMAGEQALLQKLRDEFKGRLVIMATHRPGPLALADRLLLLDGGQVVAHGPRDEVLQALQNGQVTRAPRAPQAEAT